MYRYVVARVHVQTTGDVKRIRLGLGLGYSFPRCTSETHDSGSVKTGYGY
jgi:hypothetical protein